MSMTSWLGVTILALAVARVTRLVVLDEITVGFRSWVIRRFGDDHKLTYLVHCPWCVSIWVGIPMVALAVTVPNKLVMGIMLWLAISYIVGLLAQLDRG